MSEKVAIDEVEVVSYDDGKRLAEEWRDNPKKALKLPNALLTSKDIEKLVKKTGVICPFFKGGGDSSRLKKASYEGRIGKSAYIYKDRNIPEKIYCAESFAGLLIPHNSIVFVECDLDFRIPEFVALRFNLQIQHVHRGLLLGTGPLVDPGYWGKLCIPLHNLTDRDYWIPKEQGLIWVEFTKTSLPVGQSSIGRDAISGQKEHWEIRKLLDKAAQQYTGEKIPLKSSISGAIQQFSDKASNAADSAKEAENTVKQIRTFGTLAALGVVIGVFTLAGSYYSDVSDHLEKTLPEIEAVKTDLERHIGLVGRAGQLDQENSNAVSELSQRVEEQAAEIEALKAELERLVPKEEPLGEPSS